MNSKPPMTRVIWMELEAKIASGELSEGDRLYSLRQIAGAYGVSLAVAVSAVRRLERKGLVVTEPGRGSFIRKARGGGDKLRLCSWNGVFPPNSAEILLDPARNPAAPKACEVAPFFTDGYEDYQQYLDHLTAAADGRQRPTDIVALDEGLLPVMAGLGLLAPLDPLLRKGGIVLDGFPPRLLQGMSLNGKLYGLPMTFSPFFLLYNKRLLAEGGSSEPDESWGWEELFEAASRLGKSQHGTPATRYGLGISFSINAYSPFVRQNGGELLDHRGSCAIGDKAAVEALEYFSRLYSLPGVCSHRYGSPRSELADLLANGLLAMLLGDADDYQAISSSMPAGDWGVCGLPKGKSRRATSLAIHGWGVAAASPAPEKACKALAAFLDPCGMKAFAREVHGFPAFRPEEMGTPSKAIELLDEAEISLLSTSPNAFKAFHTTLDVALNQRMLLSTKNCIDFQRKINEML